MESILSAAGQNASDIFRHILQIPLVDQTVDLSGFLVTLVRRICIIDNAHKTNAPNREQAVDILLHQFQLSGKSRLGFAEDNIKLPCLCIRQEPLELRSVAISTRIIVVAVNIVDIPALAIGILNEHSLLVLNAVAVLVLIQFVPIFFRKSAVNCYIHCFISLLQK